MYKILNSSGLGVAGKQNELIELALTHGFQGVEVDIVDLVGRHDTLGKQFACQFLQSAKIDMGTFELPIDLGASEEDYVAGIANLDTIIDLATTLNARCLYIKIAPSNGLYSFQECFEKHEERLKALAVRFAESKIKIGLLLRANEGETADGEFKFINTAEALLPLVKAVGDSNVGVCLDAWQWAAGGGTLEQLTEAGLGEVIIEARLADISEGADMSALTANDRSTLPGDTVESFSVKVCQALKAAGIEDIPFSVATNLSTYTGGSRDSVVSQVSKQLDLLIDGANPAEIKLAEQKAAEAEAAAKAEEIAAAAN